MARVKEQPVGTREAGAAELDLAAAARSHAKEKWTKT